MDRTKRQRVSIPAKFSAIALATALGIAGASAADDANYPTRSIRIMVGFAAGGAPDALARVIGDRLAQTWNQSVIVENRVGAAGNIAMAAVARARPTATRWRWCRSATPRSTRRCSRTCPTT
jgi:tripartite-type tricarboxylate transporter receptor subunit TctC